LNELIDKVVVYDAEKINGKRLQRIDIYYRFVGLILQTTEVLTSLKIDYSGILSFTKRI